MITEGQITLGIEEADIPSKEMDVFYNPHMQRNREISLLLAAHNSSFKTWYFPLAGSGIRALRIVKEAGIGGTVYVNDKRPSFPKQFERSRNHNDVEDVFSVHTEDARQLTYEIPSFSFVDVDPYGSPNMFLDSILQKTRYEGVACITATDTAPLCGTYPKTCRRKYWGEPRRDYMMKEYGLRILIRKCQLVAAQHSRALIPLICYAGRHYFKCCFRCVKRKTRADEILKQHNVVNGVGPLWTGPLQDKLVLDELDCSLVSDETARFVDRLRKEAEIGVFGHYDIHDLSSELVLKETPGTDTVINRLQDKGKACRTHFSENGFKTDLSEREVLDVFKVFD